MAVAFSFNDGTATAMLAALVKVMDDLTDCVVDVYAGTDGAETKLVSFTLPNPSGTVESKTLTFAAMPDATAIAAGTAAFFRVHVSGGTTVFVGPAGAAGSGSVLELSKAEIAQGDVVKMISASIILP